MGISTGAVAKPLGKAFNVWVGIFVATVIPASIYTVRSINSFIVTYPFWWGIQFTCIGFIAIVAFSMLVAAIYAVAWRRGWLAPGHTNLLPLLVAIILASVLAEIAPVLPTTEQKYFETHRSEFEQQVKLVRRGQNVEPYGDLGIYTIPHTETIVFEYAAPNYKSSYAYVYAEKYSDLASVLTCSATDGSGGLGQVYASLSVNWYLCYRTGD
jgi:hypothetical protein